MEKDIAILIADLSGYTALTEVHGALSAAELIDKFIAIVQRSLVGDAFLQERVGDEVMLLAETPDDLLATALLLHKNATFEEHFLLVHGGLHYGKLLQRNNSYFGSAINFASRMAAKAKAGTFWCSKEFYMALTNKSLSSFESKGFLQFKNIADPKEIYELVMDKTRFLAIDPVCRMLIQSKETAIQHPVEKDVFFCSADCLDIYRASNNSQSPL